MLSVFRNGPSKRVDPRGRPEFESARGSTPLSRHHNARRRSVPRAGDARAALSFHLVRSWQDWRAFDTNGLKMTPATAGNYQTLTAGRLTAAAVRVCVAC